MKISVYMLLVKIWSGPYLPLHGLYASVTAWIHTGNPLWSLFYVTSLAFLTLSPYPHHLHSFCCVPTARTVSSVASSTVFPLLQTLQPQIFTSWYLWGQTQKEKIGGMAYSCSVTNCGGTLNCSGFQRWFSPSLYLSGFSSSPATSWIKLPLWPTSHF